MPTMGWCTAGPSKRLKPSGPNFKLAWKNAAWRCIPPKPRSSIVRTESAKGRIRTSRLTSLDTSFDRGWSEALEMGNYFAFHLRCQRLFAEGHPIDGPGLGHPAAHRGSLDDIARMLNPLLRGWIQYYGRYNPSALEIMLRYVNLTVLRWVMRKFKRFQGRKVGAANFLEKLVRI